MRTELLDYDLPRELIATRPAEPRENARLLVCSRSDPTRLEHRIVRDLPELLAAGDRLVFNATRVLPARLLATVLETGGKAEGLYMEELEPPTQRDGQTVLHWRVLVKAKRARPGRRLGLLTPEGEATRIEMTLTETLDDEGGGWRVEVIDWSGESVETPTVLDRIGRTPLPPYIRSARKESGVEPQDAADRAWYQTTLAHEELSEQDAARVGLGSVAAPTAGLHFTPELFEALSAVGVARSEVTLHVGAGTFKPIETDEVEAHPMHAEWCTLAPSGAAALEQKAQGTGRIIPVGSTSARTLESFAGAQAPGDWLPTRLMITPGYDWKIADGLLTNFHLPRSTLLVMVAALFGSGEDGVERLREIYTEAVREKYRFFSYGDAMLILP